ncbi:hypothetical protein [Paenibacillus tundrae]|uniref:hypothetical protein n=1 Tax=Paenibacillus tundrae TaxID=528187 RepID=UPI0030D1ED06
MYRIGVVGPKLSIERTMQALQGQQLEANYELYPYEHARETVDIIRRNRENVHGWVFTGPIPYLTAQTVLHKKEHVIYCPPTGASLYKAILQAVYSLDTNIKEMSIDMPDNESWGMMDSLEELNFTENQLRKYVFSIDYDVQEMVEFHVKHWQEGRTKAAITCLYAVYEELLERGVPVFKINSTKLETIQAVRMLVEQIRSSAFKDSQIGVLMIEIDRLHEAGKHSTERYQLQHMELKIKSLLLHHCERIDGSLHQDGTGRYLMYGSRGGMARNMDSLFATMQQLELDTDLPSFAGIGFGETAFDAERHARKAIQYAKDDEAGQIIIYETDGTIVEMAGEDQALSYETYSSDVELLEQLNKAGVSIRTFQKIKAYMRRIGKEEFTASELASGLSMTVRHVQRIMGSLTAFSLAEIAGSELNTRRGRPSNRYRLIR